MEHYMLTAAAGPFCGFISSGHTRRTGPLASSAKRFTRINQPASSARAPTSGRGWLSTLLGATLVLTACGGDGIETDETGGSGGEGDVTDGPSPVAPYVGLWNITGSWSGIPDLPQDEAILVVRPLDAEGSAEVVILDYDDGGLNCYFSLSAVGKAFESPVNEGEVFLDGISDFDRAVMSLSNSDNTLTLQYTDLNDIDNDDDDREIVTYGATRMPGLTESDVALCSREP